MKKPTIPFVDVTAEFILLDVKCCARCGQDHKQLRFDKLSRPSRHTHWSRCPVNAEPVMLHVAQDRKRPNRRPPGCSPCVGGR